MKWFVKKNLFFKLLIIILFLICLTVSYTSYKKYTVKIAVENYLEEDLGLFEKDIIELKPFFANLSGDKNWLVYVKLKDDPKSYYYYKHKGKVILESFILDGIEYIED